MKLSDFSVPDLAIKYILFQRTELIRFSNLHIFRAATKVIPGLSYNTRVQIEARIRSHQICKEYFKILLDEYHSIQSFLPKECSNILDIGCGMAGIDIFLDNHYKNGEVKFYLLDRTHIDSRVYYMYQDRGSFYNSLPVAKQLLESNGISPQRIALLEASDDLTIPIKQGLDLVVSLISWGYHYPVSTYLDSAYALLRKTGSLIIDIREGSNGLDTLVSKFGGSNVSVILNSKKFLRVHAVKSGC